MSRPAFQLTLPLVSLSEELSASCRLTVPVPGRSPQLAGVAVLVEQGVVTQVSPGLEMQSDTFATGAPIDWLDTLVDPAAGRRAERLKAESHEPVLNALRQIAAEELLELLDRLVHLIGGCLAIDVRNAVADAVDRGKSSSLERANDSRLLESLVVVRRLRLLERRAHQPIEYSARLNHGVELADPYEEGKKRRVTLISLGDGCIESLPPIRLVKFRWEHPHPVAKARRLSLEILQGSPHLVEPGFALSIGYGRLLRLRLALAVPAHSPGRRSQQVKRGPGGPALRGSNLHRLPSHLLPPSANSPPGAIAVEKGAPFLKDRV